MGRKSWRGRSQLNSNYARSNESNPFHNPRNENYNSGSNQDYRNQNHRNQNCHNPRSRPNFHNSNNQSPRREAIRNARNENNSRYQNQNRNQNHHQHTSSSPQLEAQQQFRHQYESSHQNQIHSPPSFRVQAPISPTRPPDADLKSTLLTYLSTIYTDLETLFLPSTNHCYSETQESFHASLLETLNLLSQKVRDFPLTTSFDSDNGYWPPNISATDSFFKAYAPYHPWNGTFGGLCAMDWQFEPTTIIRYVCGDKSQPVLVVTEPTPPASPPKAQWRNEHVSSSSWPSLSQELNWDQNQNYSRYQDPILERRGEMVPGLEFGAKRRDGGGNVYSSLADILNQGQGRGHDRDSWLGGGSNDHDFEKEIRMYAELPKRRDRF